MHPTSIFDLVLRDHELRLAEASVARERARRSGRPEPVRSARPRAHDAGRPPDPALLFATLLRSTLGVTAR